MAAGPFSWPRVFRPARQITTPAARTGVCLRRPVLDMEFAQTYKLAGFARPSIRD